MEKYNQIFIKLSTRHGIAARTHITQGMTMTNVLYILEFLSGSNPNYN